VAYDNWRQKTAAAYLSSVLGFLRRDYETLLSEGRDDELTALHVRAAAAVVRQAQARLLAHPGMGGLDASERVKGWRGLAAVAHALAVSAARRRALPVSSVPPIPKPCSSYDELAAYFAALDEPRSVTAQTAGQPPKAATATEPPTATRITTLPPERVTLTLFASRAQIQVQSTTLRRDQIPGRVWTLIFERIAAAAGEWITAEGAKEGTVIAPESLRFMAEGAYGTVFRKWWRGTVGSGDPLKPARKADTFLLACRFRLAPVDAD
jgi:hypothetical protein